MLVPFDYRPRTRPVAPFFPLSCFFSTVKHMPEEWEETALVVEPAAGSKLGCVQCQVNPSPSAAKNLFSSST